MDYERWYFGHFHGNYKQGNIDLFTKYVIDESKAREILLALQAIDFSERVQNEHIGYKHEKLYIFGKDVKLLEKFGTAERIVHLYIKINKLDNGFVVIISFHEENYPITYYFK